MSDAEENFDPETGEIIEDEEQSSLERYLEIIAKRNGVILSKEEPAAMLITLFEAFAEDLDGQLDKRDGELRKFLGTAGKLLGKQVEKTFAELREKAVLDNLVKAAVTVDEINKSLAAGQKHLEKTRKTILWAAAAIWLAALPVFITLILILTK